MKTIITLLLIAPPALLAIENIAMRPIKHPRPELVRTWDIEDDTHDGRLRYVFSIHEDGTVDGTIEAVGGTVGKVAMKEAYLKRNRHWFSKLLHQRRDYKVKGRVESSPVEEPRDWFWIEFNCDKQGTMTRIKAGF
jgi:hypothetical protein